MATNKPAERKVPHQMDAQGRPEWKSPMTTPDESVAVLSMVSDRIIPIVFVPGVMGSNLRGVGDSAEVLWRLDSNATMAVWLGRDAEDRKRHLTPQKMRVDSRGAVPLNTALSQQELWLRGWGEVGAMSYTQFLAWLEDALSDFSNAKSGVRQQLIGQALGAMKGESALSKDDVALSYKYRFPVHAFGYNWLDDNVNSAKLLKKRIEEIIERYRRQQLKCENVIIVSHSMGGLVTRYCTEVLGMAGAVLGVVHGVMPAIGAAAVYRRLQSGTEGDYIPGKVLGEDGEEMTAVLSGAPGPMQLLPTPQYGNGWLRIREVIEGKYNEHALPQNADPYNEVYLVRGKWWSMINDRFVDPLLDKNGQNYLAERNNAGLACISMIRNSVEPFHRSIEEKYHSNTHVFFGSHEDFRAYGSVTWTARDKARKDARANRKSDFMNATRRFAGEDELVRNVESKLYGEGMMKTVMQEYMISSPEESGDGTVPHRSGVAPLKNMNVKSGLQLRAGHEPAFRDSMLARRFTLRAIVQIAREVEKTPLAYE